jgi:hypothetical protein
MATGVRDFGTSGTIRWDISGHTGVIPYELRQNNQSLDNTISEVNEFWESVRIRNEDYDRPLPVSFIAQGSADSGMNKQVIKFNHALFRAVAMFDNYRNHETTELYITVDDAEFNRADLWFPRSDQKMMITLTAGDASKSIDGYMKRTLGGVIIRTPTIILGEDGAPGLTYSEFYESESSDASGSIQNSATGSFPIRPRSWPSPDGSASSMHDSQFSILGKRWRNTYRDTASSRPLRDLLIGGVDGNIVRLNPN